MDKEELLQELQLKNPEALAQVAEKLKNSVTEELKRKVQESTKGLKIKDSLQAAQRPATKKARVRLRLGDGIGAASLPEGYMAAIQKPTTSPALMAPISHHERNRIAQESKPYVAPKAKTNQKILRVGGGEVWEDSTLVHWDDDDYRLFAGDLGNEVTDDLLSKAFAHYPSLIRVAVIRDKRTNKSKGYGFISFKDPDDYVKAVREMNGKYVGNRPITLKKSNVKERMATKESIKHQKELAALKGE